VGIEFVTKTMTVDEEEIKAQIWDTAGQERFSSMMGTYYRKAKGALLLFSVSDAQSFVDAKGWLQQIQELGEEGTMVLLVGNKSDVESPTREVQSYTRRGESIRPLLRSTCQALTPPPPPPSAYAVLGERRGREGVCGEV
jgi:small GTP-binding protein